MNQIIVDFTSILIKDKKDNTYKFALARFILDYISKNFIKKTNIISDKKIKYEEIAEEFLKYYWNQVVVYKLKQDFKTRKKTKLVSIIEDKTKDINSLYEVYFKNGQHQKLKTQLINDIYNYCLIDVIPRFQKTNKQNIYRHFAIQIKTKTDKLRYYKPEKERRIIILKKEAIEQIKLNYNLLFEVVILEWSKFLEKTNFTPRLIEKVERLNNPKRNPLEKYKKILFSVEKIPRCFYCDKILDLNNKRKIHIDHFIPWSYIFEDNEWNLVLSCQDCNLRKSNYLPTESCLTKLKQNKSYLKNFNEELIDNYYMSCKKEGFIDKFECNKIN